MKWKVVAIALVAAACNGSEEESPMPGMTAEEHAQMEAAEPTTAEAAVERQVVHLTADQESALGVTYTSVIRERLVRTIRTVGRVEAAEPRIADVTPKIEGFVEELFVDYTGQQVRAGQPLLTLYSPIMVAAQEELLTASRMLERIEPSAVEAYRNAEATRAAARRRLQYWDITDEQIDQIETSGTVSKTLTLVAPTRGTVLEKSVVEGQRVMAGARLYRIADLSELWVEGDVFEQDLQLVREGAQAHIEVAAYPGEHLMGIVSFVYPIVDEATRTNRVRVTVPNPLRRLKPGMYSTIYFDAEVGQAALAVPLDAVIVTGERNLVFVRAEDGMLYPRQVVLGIRAGRKVQILEGLEEGETVVASANFLIDAESRLASTGGAMPGHAGHGAAVEPEPASEGHQHD